MSINNKNNTQVNKVNNNINLNTKSVPIKSNDIIKSNNDIKITVGNKLLKMEKSEQKVFELEEKLKMQNEIIQKLKLGVEPYTKEINNLNKIIIQLQKENTLLKSNGNNIDIEKNKITEKLMEEINIKNELIESNKKLQRKIESLNKELMDINNRIQKDKDEYNNMCKVKDNYENDIIQLTNSLENTNNKLIKADNIIKQKDKYIEILMHKLKCNSINENNIIFNNKRPSSTTNIKKNKTLYKQTTKFNNDDKDNNVTIIEQANTIKKLNEKIKALEKNNASLLIRLKNSITFNITKK